jgi:hypothetical protein
MNTNYELVKLRCENLIHKFEQVFGKDGLEEAIKSQKAIIKLPMLEGGDLEEYHKLIMFELSVLGLLTTYRPPVSEKHNG